MSSTVVHDPSGAAAGGLPLDRAPHLALVAAVLAWGPAPAGVRAADCAQIGLHLTAHAQCVAADLRQRYEALPADSELRPLTMAVLREAVNRLSTGPATTVARVQNRARLIGALYRALDRIDTTQNPAPGQSPQVAPPWPCSRAATALGASMRNVPPPGNSSTGGRDASGSGSGQAAQPIEET
ncbi:hypothetical protein [Streptomyces sp. NPDC055107]